MRKTRIEFSGDLEVETWSICLPFDRRLILNRFTLNNESSLDITVMKQKGKISDKIKNIPDDYLVCSEGCPTFAGEEFKLPCGKCGAKMKPKGEVYPMMG